VLRWQAALSIFILALIFSCGVGRAQVQPPSDKLLIDASTARTWSEGAADVIQVQGPVTIKLDRMELTADNAVIWLSPEPGLVIDQEKAEIALIGHAVAQEPARGVTRTGSKLLVTASVRGDIRLTASQRLTEDQSSTATYELANRLRAASNPKPVAGDALQPNPAEVKTFGEKLPTPSYLPSPPTGEHKLPTFDFHFNKAEPIPTSDGMLAWELTGDVLIVRNSPNGDFLSLRADQAVIFTNEKSGSGFTGLGSDAVKGDVKAAYLESDVRIDFSPKAAATAAATTPEQRLFAQRVYYKFDTDQAILTDAVVRTAETLPGGETDITIRAAKLRQLAQQEYEGEGVELSTSSFATPTYSMKTSEVYVHQETVPVSQGFGYEHDANGQVVTEPQTAFVATGDTMSVFGVPAFYFPSASGTIDSDPFPLRTINILKTKRLGDSIATEWGLFESAGRPHPSGLDISFLADFFGNRGPATGINALYSGANVDQDSKDVADYSGRVQSFVIDDRGIDQLGGDRSDVTPPDSTRGKFLFEHQQNLSDDWQVQLRYGYVSDPTFLEEYYQDEFDQNQPYDAVAYAKRQDDTEALTLLANADTNRFVTTSDRAADQFDVEKLPEVGYQRIGDSVGDDNLTFFSNNTFDRLRFDKSHYSLDQQGYVGFTPGIPSEGYTGTITSPVYRGDTRQEIDYPVQLGQIKMVPYVVGRDTGYSDSPEDDDKNRVYGAAGVRFTTDFWKVDDQVDSDLFDLHRMRHVIEPEINLYTSGETVDRDQLYVYDENVDGISDVSAIEGAIHQRWETYRGAPGRQQSVDFLTFNISADVYTNPPTDAGLLPDKFRGLFFASAPETSIPRDAINSDATWLISNSTALLADAEYNVDHQTLATGSVGLSVQRLDRMTYYFGLRYIEPLDSDLATFSMQYQLSDKYALEFTQSYDFSQSQDVSSEIGIIRAFDTVTAKLTIFSDSTTGDNGVTFNIFPTGLGPSVSSSAGKTVSNNPH
jgi:hypothetical protein